MKIKFITNLCFEITFSNGRRLLTDPWFEGPAFYGAWHNFPPVPKPVKEDILQSNPDWIYISHLHPDHCDKKTLSRFPKHLKILIAKFPQNHLRRIIEGLGFVNIIEIPFHHAYDLDGLKLSMFDDFASSNTGAISNVKYALDTSLLIEDIDGKKIFNCVDNPIRIVDAQKIGAACKKIDLAILPLGGASSYPQAFSSYSESEKISKRSIQEAAAVDKFFAVAQALKADVLIPAAGDYVLGGSLAHLNGLIPRPNRENLKQKIESSGQQQLISMNSGDVFNLNTRETTPSQLTREDISSYTEALKFKSLDHEKIFIPAEFEIPWGMLLHKATANLRSVQGKINIYPDWNVTLKLGNENHVHEHIFSLEKSPENTNVNPQRIIFELDARLMLMLLIGSAVWDNVYVSSLIRTDRTPDVFDPDVTRLMSFFRL